MYISQRLYMGNWHWKAWHTFLLPTAIYSIRIRLINHSFKASSDGFDVCVFRYLTCMLSLHRIAQFDVIQSGDRLTNPLEPEFYRPKKTWNVAPVCSFYDDDNKLGLTRRDASGCRAQLHATASDKHNSINFTWVFILQFICRQRNIRIRQYLKCGELLGEKSTTTADTNCLSAWHLTSARIFCV